MGFFDRLFQRNEPQPPTESGPWRDELESLARRASADGGIPEYLRYPYHLTAQEKSMACVNYPEEGYMCKVFRDDVKGSKLESLPADDLFSSYTRRIFHTGSDRTWSYVSTVRMSPRATETHRQRVVRVMAGSWATSQASDMLPVPRGVEGSPTELNFFPLAPLVMGSYAQAHGLDTAELVSLSFRLGNDIIRTFRLYARKGGTVWIAATFSPGRRDLSPTDYLYPSLLLGSFFPSSGQ
ncbi:MAG: hypothetical protein IKP22_11805 [Clostridia bacterium]|nr:hypothetical protein [Clostridia bacterium]